MKNEPIRLLAVTAVLVCGVLAQRALSAQGTNAASQSVDFKVLQWPDDKALGGFMTGLQLVSLSPERCKDIIAKAKPNKEPAVKPDFKTPLAAAEYFGSHLNMGGPPKYMAVHSETNGTKYYLFSGGRHWGRQPLFSETAVLLETGEIRFYKKAANKASDAASESAPGVGSEAASVVLNPVAYVKANPEFRTDDNWIWKFQTNGTFKAYAMTSAFSYTFEGSWSALEDSSITLTGTRWNGSTKKSRPEVCIITSIAASDDSNPPVVRLEKTVKSELEIMTMPTKPSTATE